MTLLHDIRVPPLNKGSVHNGDDGVRQCNRSDNTAGSFICVVGELSSYSADSIQLWYSYEMEKLPESGPNLVFGILTGGYGKKVCGSLDFDEENGAFEIQRLDDKGDRETYSADATYRNL